MQDTQNYLASKRKVTITSVAKNDFYNSMQDKVLFYAFRLFMKTYQ